MKSDHMHDGDPFETAQQQDREDRTAAAKLHVECLRSNGITPSREELRLANLKPTPMESKTTGDLDAFDAEGNLKECVEKWARVEEPKNHMPTQNQVGVMDPEGRFTFRDWDDWKIPQEPRPCTVKVEGLNPKDARALDRVPLWALPTIGAIHGAQACGDGIEKYGAYNWRDKPIKLMEYIGAMERHIACLKDGQWRAADSGFTHLGHINATSSIMLDAEQCGTLIDDRPARPGRAHEELGAYRENRKSNT